MKLMMLSDYPADADAIGGGVAAAAYNLVNALLNYTDLDIVVFSFTSSVTTPSSQTHAEGRLKVVSCPAIAKFGLVRGFRHERRLFRDWVKAEQPDVIHAQSEGLYASLAVESGIPAVYTIHGIRLKELQIQRKKLGPVRYFLGTRLIKKHHRKARHIVAINEYTRNEIRDLHSAKVWLIHNAVDEHFFDLYANDDSTVGKLLQVGGIRPRKDIITALKAVDWLQRNGMQVTLDVVGPVNKKLLPEIEAYIEQHDLASVVSIRGLVSAEDLDRFYCNADILVMSSMEESSPIAIVQGMAAGKPVVSTDVGGIREMIEEGVNGYLVAVRDGSSLGEKIALLVTDRKKRSEFAQASREMAVRDWSTRAVARKTYEMYEEMVNDV